MKPYSTDLLTPWAMPFAPPPDDNYARMVSLAELAGKAAIGLGSVWTFVQLIVKPYTVWRRKRLTEAIEELLGPKLARLEKVIEIDENCTSRIEKVLNRQDKIFEELDIFVEIATDNRDRHDETSELLNVVFGLDRRVNTEKQKRIDSLMIALRERREARHREEPAPPIPDPSAP